MVQQRLLGGGAALLALLTACGAAAAQTAADLRSPLTVGRSFYSSAGPGYTVYVPTASFPEYNFFPGYYTGYPVPGRFRTSTGYYSQLAPSYSPIMLTSINYPGVYGSFDFGLTPSAYNVTPTFATRVYNPPSALPVGMPYVPLERETAADRPAQLDVSLPADAVLEVDGQPTSQTGARRVFESPPLVPFRTYSYDLRARWTVGDREVVQNRHVRVSAGERVEVDFGPGRRLREEEPSTLETRPLPLRRSPTGNNGSR
jgi:uncharacterized protein (TIGR03000 family)